MLDVFVTEEKRTRCEATESFSASDHSRKVFGMYGGREELVTLECRERLAGVMIDRFGTEPTFYKTDFGFKFSIRLMVSPNFFAWVMGFGDEMRILSPDSVRGEMTELLSKTMKFYGE